MKIWTIAAAGRDLMKMGEGGLPISEASKSPRHRREVDVFTALPNGVLTARRLRSLNSLRSAQSVRHMLCSDAEVPSAVSIDQVLAIGQPVETVDPARGLIHLDEGTPEIWSRVLVGEAEGGLLRLSPGATLRLASVEESRQARNSLDAALKHLRVHWAQAAVETSLLVRACVHVLGQDFASVTSSRNLGIVIINVAASQRLDGAIEHLLHEAGHSSLFLGEHFDRYLHNPDDQATHPLRQDARPLSGVLHAAVATFRVAAGLSKMRSMWPETPGMQTRYDSNLDALEEILQTLAGHADWTPAGITLFESLNSHLPTK